jgi:hypothetical protein
MRCMNHSAILLKVDLVSFIIFQSRNEGIHDSVTVPLVVEKKMGPTMRLRGIPTQTPISHHAAATRGKHGDCMYTRNVSFDC